MGKVNPLRFSTKFDDDESDLLYYGYRYYVPGTGTWSSRDTVLEIGFVTVFGPADESEDTSEYGFVRNEAISGLDNLGEETWNGLICSCTYGCSTNFPTGGTLDGGAICSATNVGAVRWRTDIESCENRAYIYGWCYDCSKKHCTHKCQYKCSKGRLNGVAGYYWVTTGVSKLVSKCL